MPEEVVLSLKLTRTNIFVEYAISYLKKQLNDMQIQEVAKVFFALTRKKDALSYSGDSKHDQELQKFLVFMSHYFTTSLERFDDKSMAYVLSMMANSAPAEDKQKSSSSDLQETASSAGVTSTFFPPEMIRE